jgi:hypothetical protein
MCVIHWAGISGTQLDDAVIDRVGAASIGACIGTIIGTGTAATAT